MITLCYAAKGGSGTTVVACAHAINSAGPSLLVDLDGDIPPMLGIPEPDRPGVIDWIASRAPTAHLDDLLVTVTPNCSLLPARLGGASPADELPAAALDRWEELIEWFTEWSTDTGGSVVIDAGTNLLPTAFAERCPQRWLVTRACYLSLRRAGRLQVAPTGVVFVAEPGRTLGERDIETSVRAPIIATIDWDIRVARSIDTGLLLGGRLPRSLHRALTGVAA